MNPLEFSSPHHSSAAWFSLVSLPRERIAVWIPKAAIIWRDQWAYDLHWVLRIVCTVSEHW